MWIVNSRVDLDNITQVNSVIVRLGMHLMEILYSLLTSVCGRLIVFPGEFWSFRYFKDMDLRETKNRNMKSVIGLCTILLILFIN